VTFYAFPKEHWKHLRTTNVVESPFAAVRLRTGAAMRFKHDAVQERVERDGRDLEDTARRRAELPSPQRAGDRFSWDPWL
jgi:transposase-like protein